MTALTPTLAIVAARLPSPPSSTDVLDDEVAGDTPTGAASPCRNT